MEPENVGVQAINSCLDEMKALLKKIMVATKTQHNMNKTKEEKTDTGRKEGCR